MNNLKYITKAFIIQAIEVVALILLSLIGFIFNIWELIVSTSISGIFSFAYLFLMFRSVKYISHDANASSASKFLFSTILRLLVAAVGILIPALIFKLTDNGNNLRYLCVIAATIPFLCVNFTLSLVKGEISKEGK